MKKLLLPLLAMSTLSGCVVVVGDVDDRPTEHFSRHLTLSADDLKRLDITSAAGELKVVGVAELSQIEVDADIWTHSTDEDAYTLKLQRSGHTAELIAKNVGGYGIRINIGSGDRIDLTVRVPARLALDVDDGSGNMEIADIMGDVKVEDGSGGIDIRHLGGDLAIDDGSGEIFIDDVAGNVDIDDGSGNMRVSRVRKTLTIDDGSGNIDVTDIGKLKIEDSGSGNVVIHDAE